PMAQIGPESTQSLALTPGDQPVVRSQPDDIYSVWLLPLGVRAVVQLGGNRDSCLQSLGQGGTCPWSGPDRSAPVNTRLGTEPPEALRTGDPGRGGRRRKRGA